MTEARPPTFLIHRQGARAHTKRSEAKKVHEPHCQSVPVACNRSIADRGFTTMGNGRALAASHDRIQRKYGRNPARQGPGNLQQ